MTSRFSEPVSYAAELADNDPLGSVVIRTSAALPSRVDHAYLASSRSIRARIMSVSVMMPTTFSSFNTGSAPIRR